ncbi:MAG: hypothetical protein V4622_13215 [Bacteroidota bacterium]
MKYLLILIFFVSTNLFSQVIIKFVDVNKNTPIENVFLTKKSGETISITNLKGECFILQRDLEPLTATHLSYKSINFSPKNDTIIYLKNTTQEIEEVSVKGMTNDDLFQEILVKSSKKVKKEGVKIEGTYFEMAYYIDETYKDTVHIIFTADMEAVLPKKKKSKFEYYLSNEKKYMSDLSKIKRQFDTAQYNRALSLTGFLDNQLEFNDLRNVKNYKKHNFQKSSRTPDSIPSITFYKEKKIWDNQFQFYYDPNDSTMLSNTHTTTSDKVYNNENIFIDFKYRSASNSYTNNPFYFINFLSIENEILMKTTKNSTRIIGVKCFLIKGISEIDENYESTKTEVKDLFKYNRDFPATNEKLPILFNQTRF